MKNLIKFSFAFLCLMLVSNLLFAQEEEKSEKEKKKNKTLSFYSGLNFNGLTVSEPDYASSAAMGTHVGIGYRIGNFLYVQPGLRYSWSIYDLTQNKDVPEPINDDLKLQRLGIPVDIGINIVPVANGLLNLRFFTGLEPAFLINVSENDFDYKKDDLNSTLFFGTVGIGVDITFILFEIGYNAGFGNLLKNDIASKPGQAFINLGIRF